MRLGEGAQVHKKGSLSPEYLVFGGDFRFLALLAAEGRALKPEEGVSGEAAPAWPPKPLWGAPTHQTGDPRLQTPRPSGGG